ncbi:MAG: hypothetical protein IT462_10550 [Planctomycetes bacterium]|nr:hypothetical protein [Planctomycetota bacterium]
MKKLMTSLGLIAVSGLMAGQLQAGFSLFDTAKDSGYIARGRFIGLERTAGGDRLTFRLDSFIKGSIAETEVVIEPFDKAYNDVAVGQDAIVGFTRSNVDQKYRTSWGIRSIFLPNQNLTSCDTALQNLVAINAPYQAVIDAELAKRAEYQDPGYEGVFPGALMEAWRTELLSQISLAGSDAAKSAAQVLVEHKLFKGTVGPSQLAQYVAPRVTLTPSGTKERAYVLMLIGSQPSLYPNTDELFTMLGQEMPNSEISCAGHIAGLLRIKPRTDVVTRLQTLVTGDIDTPVKANALFVAETLKDISTLPMVQGLLTAQSALGADADLTLTRAALKVLRATPHSSSAQLLVDFLASDLCKQDKNPDTWWEMTRRGIVAYAMINNPTTNAKVREWFFAAEGARRQYLRFMIEENKDWRPVVMIFNEKN